MKLMKIMILAVALPMVVQAAEQRVKPKNSGWSFSCHCAAAVEEPVVVEAAVIVEDPEVLKQRKVEQYFKAHPKERVHHLTTDSGDMRANRILLHAPLNSPSAIKEIEAEKYAQRIIVKIESEELQAEQKAHAKSGEKEPQAIPGPQLLLMSKSGDVHEKRKKRTLATVIKQKEEDARSIASRSTQIFTFEKAVSKKTEEDMSVSAAEVITANLSLPASVEREAIPQLTSRSSAIIDPKELDRVAHARLSSLMDMPLPITSPLPEFAAITEPTIQLPGIPDEA